MESPPVAFSDGEPRAPVICTAGPAVRQLGLFSPALLLRLAAGQALQPQVQATVHLSRIDQVKRLNSFKMDKPSELALITVRFIRF